MTLHLHTDEEKLELLEMLIEQTRREVSGARDPKDLLGMIVILRAIAADYRARPKRAGAALDLLTARLQQARDSRTPLGYAQGRLIAIATEVISQWPTIEQALREHEERHGKNGA